MCKVYAEEVNRERLDEIRDTFVKEGLRAAIVTSKYYYSLSASLRDEWTPIAKAETSDNLMLLLTKSEVE